MDKAVTPKSDPKKSRLTANKKSITLENESDDSYEDFEPSHKRKQIETKKKSLSATVSTISPSPKSRKNININSDASDVSVELLKEEVKPDRPSSNEMGINSQYPETYVIEMTRDTMIRSFNVLHEKNIQLEHTVRTG